ncbi:hypothetical protein C7B61_11215, partial [filamentous cyanobacterium CCP1]
DVVSPEVIPKQVRSRNEKALDFCDQLVNYYERNRSFNRRAYSVSQAAAVILSGVTPILILLPNVPKAVQAIPPAIASVAAGLNAFQYREKWIRCKSTAESLKVEKLKFELRISDDYSQNLPEEVVVFNFVNRVDALHSAQIQQWRNSQLEEFAKPRLDYLLGEQKASLDSNST